jgi:hypothetical protein
MSNHFMIIGYTPKVAIIYTSPHDTVKSYKDLIHDLQDSYNKEIGIHFFIHVIVVNTCSMKYML